MTRILFMGTPEFSMPVLRLLHERANVAGWEVVAAATQPDRPAGRGKRLTASPAKEFAEAHGIPVVQPVSLRRQPEAVAVLREFVPDLIVVAAYGLILPRSVLEIPTFGCINVHASLLPAYRGASPIAAAILDGRAETGISIMVMDEGMDTGPVLAQARQPILAGDTTGTLAQRLADQGAALLMETLPAWLAGDCAPVAQRELPGEPSVCRLIKKEDGLIDWQQPAAQIERMARAYTPWPGAYTYWRNEVFKILGAAVSGGQAQPGRVLTLREGPAVGTGDGLLLLKVVQPAGKRALDALSFLNGAPGFAGTQLPNRE